MAVIGITLNEVMRDFINQFAYTYSKYKSDVDLKETPVTDWDFLDVFKFKDKSELNKFLYTEASLEIFGHADQLHDNVITKFNWFNTELIDEGEHELVVISREGDRSIPATLFFLSKLGFMGSAIKFVTEYREKWDGVDILITANPVALENKPKGKVSVKVNTTYNKDIKSDYELDSIIDLFDGEIELDKFIK